jgi:signal transduction histidine kinase
VAVLFIQRKPWVRGVFNAAQAGVTMWASVQVFALLGGPIHGLEGVALARGEATAARLVLPLIGLTVTYFLVNRLLVNVAVAWSSDRPYWRALREDWFFAERLLGDAAAFLLAPLMVISFGAVGYVGVVLFYAPLRMIFESDRRYLELRDAQKQIIHSERMAAKGEFAAEIGHEIKNMLVAISGRSQMLIREAERQMYEQTGRHAQIILEQSRRMEALANGLMDFSSADLRLAETIPSLRADPGQLQQVLLNLFVNAADAIKEKPTGPRIIAVTTHIDERGRNVRIVASDTGTGIAAPHLARIFEPHFTTKTDGHGFGLSTSYRIITNHGGSITAESPPGQGATFTITLPLDGPGSWGVPGT